VRYLRISKKYLLKKVLDKNKQGWVGLLLRENYKRGWRDELV